MELTEKQVIRALRRLEKGWPKHLWLFAAAGTLNLMRVTEYGLHAETSSGGVDPDYSVEDFSGIDCDGGDW